MLPTRKTQLQRIISILEREGRISRNECLRMYISRLAARIADLEDVGWKFETRKIGNDYEYRVIKRPKAEQLVLV